MLRSGKSRLRKLSLERLVTILSAGILTAVIALSAFLSTDSTVLYPRETGEGDALRRYLLPLFPQSWPFFTKPPTDPEYSVYTVSGTIVGKATDFPNSLSSNAFGFARTQRAQGPELASLAMQVSSESWIDCVSVSGDCVVEASKEFALLLDNDSTLPSFCGTYVLSETEPVDWSFRDAYEGWRVDLRTVKVEIDCD